MSLVVVADPDLRERMRCIRIVADQTPVSALGAATWSELQRANGVPPPRPPSNPPPASCPASRVARSPILDAVLSSRLGTFAAPQQRCDFRPGTSPAPLQTGHIADSFVATFVRSVAGASAFLRRVASKRVHNVGQNSRPPPQSPSRFPKPIGVARGPRQLCASLRAQMKHPAPSTALIRETGGALCGASGKGRGSASSLSGYP